MAQQLRALALLLGLVGTSAGLRPWREAGLLPKEVELSHLVVDVVVQQPLQGHL